MNRILHISHTDIFKDARILKELNSLTNAKLNNTSFFAIGIQNDAGPDHLKKTEKVSIKNLFIKTLTFRNKFFFIGSN